MDEPQMLPPLDTRTRAQGIRAADSQKRWLGVVWVLWAGACILTLLIFVASLPGYAALLQTICNSSICADEQLTPTTAHALYTIGLSVSSYAAWRIVFSIIWTLVWFAVAAILAWHKRNERYALLVALMCLLQGATSVTNTVAQGPSPWRWVALSVYVLSFFFLFLVMLLFPDGRFVPRWNRWLVVVFLFQSVCYNFFPSVTFQLTSWTPILAGLSWIGIFLTLIAAQIYRYRYISDAVQRQQTKWIVFGFVVVFLSQMGTTLLLLLFPSLARPGSLLSLAGGPDTNFILLLIPLSFGIAILRYRLWDIDILINKALVYSTLTACIFSIYILLVGYVGLLFQLRNNLFISLLATGLVAFLFQPLREWLQRRVNRLMYGERDEPYRVISRLGQRLEATLAPEEVLPAIVETVARSLKLPHTAISLKQDDEYKIVTSYGAPRAAALRLPLVSQAETIGELLLAPRTANEPFTRSEQQLLNELARQAGMAIHGVLLTADLERSRQRIVAAREEARRRLGSDLHDGLAHRLATLVRKIDTISQLLERNPAAAQDLLVDAKQQAKSAIDDIRRLAHALHPPELELLGLVPALQERVQQYDQPDRNPLHVTIETQADLPPLPLAVEAAAYYIALEAVSNVHRHADARHCHLRLELLRSDESLHPLLGVWNTAILALEICDDGRGLPTSEQGKGAGLGLISMRERAAELGGSCVVEQAAQGGTRVSVRLPCLPLSDIRE
ncbi:MAG: GAF domain-containing sensor histidine kinase [Chloroflexi bacterium]|nr:GAF domain-containing sensor histidine kinase [Chloroflexota bacterium]